MMKRISFLTLLLTLLLILVGCDNGSVSDSVVSKSSRLVKVSLAISGDSSGIQKAAVVDGNYWTSLTYQYNAVPQWQDPDGDNIQGTAGWTTISYSAGELSLGYFAPGQWVFGVRILNGATVLYEGFSEVVNIKNSSESVDVFVTKLAESVRISVTAPTAQGDSLSISYGNGAFGPFKATATRLNGTTTFEYTFNNLPEDTYTFAFTYSSAEGSPASNSTTVGVSSGKLVVISGQLNNGSLQLVSTTVPIYTITVNRYNWDTSSFDDGTGQHYYGTVVVNTSSAVAGDRVSFYVEPISTATLDPLYPTVNGGAVTATPSGNLYSFVMPAGNVIIKAKFNNNGGDPDIDMENFKIIFQSLYDAEDVIAFGRSVNPPQGVDYLGLGDVLIWYENSYDPDTNPTGVVKKICWYSKNENTLKFKPQNGPTYASMAGFFQDYDKFESIDLTGFDTSNINNMSHMFDGCVKLKTVNLTGINTAEVTDMSYMFYKAGYSYIPVQEKVGTLLQKIPNTDDQYLSITGLNVFNTTNVTNMSYMFSLCSAQTLDVSSFNASKVTNFSHMFAGISTERYKYYWPTKFTSLNVSNWNVGGNVGANTIDMSNMFDLSYMLTSISFVGNTTSWNFSKVTTMYEMFNRCESMTRIFFPQHTDLTNVTTLKGIFNHTADMVAKGNGSLELGSFEDIFQRWDIRYNDYTQGLGGRIDFKEVPHDDVSDTSTNHIIARDTESLKAAALIVNSYGASGPGTGPEVKVGGGNADVATEQRLIKTYITVSADAVGKNIDDPEPSLTYTYSPNPLPTGVSITGELVRETGESAGTYAIGQGTLGLTGTNASKYTFIFVGNVFTINDN